MDKAEYDQSLQPRQLIPEFVIFLPLHYSLRRDERKCNPSANAINSSSLNMSPRLREQRKNSSTLQRLCIDGYDSTVGLPDADSSLDISLGLLHRVELPVPDHPAIIFAVFRHKSL